MDANEKLERISSMDLTANGKDQIARNLLGKNFNKFKRIFLAKGTGNIVRTKADIYRKMVSFYEYILEEIFELEKELTEIGVEEYFVADKQVVKTFKDPDTDSSITIVKDIDSDTEWRRANRQEKERIK